MVGACDTVGGGRRKRAHIFSLGEPELKRPLRRPRHRGENNIKMDIKEMVPEDVE